MATVRTCSLTVTFASVVLTSVIEARGEESVDGGWPTCSVFLTAKPVTGNEGDNLLIVGGAGNLVTRFTGQVNQFRPSAFPKSIEMVAMGTLGYAADWAPADDIVFDDLFPDGATGRQIIMHALDQVPQLGSGSYSSANIGGTSTILGYEAPEAFDWKAGVKAWQRIQAVDRAELYRTHQVHDGTIRREQLIGHPAAAETFTLGPADVLEGSTGNRDTKRTRNAVVVLGHDYGDGLGAVTNGVGTFGINNLQGNGSNPATRYPETFTSDMIESGTDSFTNVWDGRTGLRADTQAGLIINDVNKEFVEADIQSWRDDTHGPGLTCLLDMLARMAIGEKMYVVRYGWRFSDGWYTTYGLSGGGTYNPSYPPPGV